MYASAKNFSDVTSCRLWISNFDGNIYYAIACILGAGFRAVAEGWKCKGTVQIAPVPGAGGTIDIY